MDKLEPYSLMEIWGKQKPKSSDRYESDGNEGCLSTSSSLDKTRKDVTVTELEVSSIEAQSIFRAYADIQDPMNLYNRCCRHQIVVAC